MKHTHSTAGHVMQDWEEDDIRPQQSDEQEEGIKCTVHSEAFILFCLKDQEKVCGKCLNTTHLLHPVVPLNSLDQLDFHKSIQREVESSVKEIQQRNP